MQDSSCIRFAQRLVSGLPISLVVLNTAIEEIDKRAVVEIIDALYSPGQHDALR